MEKQHKLTQGMLGGGHSTKVLWNCVNRYVRTRGNETGRVQAGNTTGITLFLVPAGGFPKEIWETTLHSLLDSPAGYMVDEVWAWEAVQHGDSALINAHNLSGISDWTDDVRDIGPFLVELLTRGSRSEALPARLERLPESTSQARKEHGYRTRKMVAAGHSLGGCTVVRAAVDFPKLFSSIILVDAVIMQPYTNRPDYYDRVLGVISRRSQWASREDALQLFKKSPLFRTWNPEVLQLYVDHALTDDSSGGVKLKMSGVHEALCFMCHLVSWETWELLDKVDEVITLRWVVPKEGFVSEEATRVRVWRRPANSSNVIFHSFGHLIVQEAPVELGQRIDVLKASGSSSTLVTLTTNVFRRLQSHPEDLELSQWGHRPVWARVAQGKVKSFWATAQTTPPRPQNVVEFSDDEGDSQSLHQTPKGTHAAIGSVQRQCCH
ncbi:Alpha/Beta hydrolase protein [Melanogaster broomeanus]|nr:Alpha/Beta hydrolase protein [Melanogaster broomeanus]